MRQRDLERNPFVYARAMKEQRRTELLRALTGQHEPESEGDELDRLADAVAERVVRTLTQPES